MKSGPVTLAVIAGAKGHSVAEKVVAQYMEEGATFVEDEQALARAAICDNCQYMKPTSLLGGPQCTRCKCFLSVKATVRQYFDPLKLKVSPAACPMGFWETVDQNY